MSCCTYGVFMEDFHYYWSEYFDQPPTAAQLKRTKKDWREGSTGYEGVRIAKELETEAAAKALEKPLVNIGGRNFAYADSELAKKYGAASEPLRFNAEVNRNER